MHARLICLVSLMAAVASFGDTATELEKQAAQLMGKSGREKAVSAYRTAAARRAADTEKLLASAKKDDLEIDTDMTSDDDMMPEISKRGDQLEADTQALACLQTAVDFNYGAKPRECDRWFAKACAIAGVSKKVTEKLEKFKQDLALERDPTEKESAPAPAAPKKDEVASARAALDAAIKSGASPRVLAGHWSKLAYAAFLHFRPEICAEAKAAIEQLRCKPGCYPGRWVPSIRAFENLKTFPKAESETVAPKTLKELGVEDKRTAIVGELDWNAEDATACVEEALASGATTLIFEDRGSPWYVRTIVPRSNQRLVFKKGVKVLMDPVSRRNRDKSAMIVLKDVENVIIEGEGGPGDVWVGKYATVAERNADTRDYGGSGLSIEGAKNCVIRNITFGANSMDGVCLSGGNTAARDIWLENLVLTGNYRQAMSVCDAIGLYCRNVSFLDTIGGDPMCGIDFEPTFETEANADCYFYDCTFGANAGAAVNWSSSSYYPVTCLMKRCHFEKARNCGQITIFARCGIYMGNDVKAPSKIVFEDCDMAVNTDSFPLRIENGNFFDIEVKNFKIREIGPHNPNVKAWGNAPVTISLTREYGSGVGYFDRHPGSVRIEGLDVTGWTNHPILEFRDRIGTCGFQQISGSGRMNGKDWDFSKFSYAAPESGLKEIARFDPAAYAPPAKTEAANPSDLPQAFTLTWDHTWFEYEPVYRALYFECGVWKMKKILPGVTDLALEKFPVAYYCRGNGTPFKLVPKKGSKQYAVYFEVPAGKTPATLKIGWGKGRLRNAKGDVVKEFGWSGSAQYATCVSTTGASEIWSLELDTAVTLKFFAPFAGIIAESPDALPRLRAN